MANATTINIRMDEGLKTKFSDFCAKTGMTMTTAFTMFAKDTVRNQALPFAVTTKKRKVGDPFWSEENQAHLRRSIEEIESGHWVVHEPEEALKHA